MKVKGERPVEMGIWKFWLHFNFKSSFLLPAKSILLSGASHLQHRTKKNREGLVTLYQDMEACGGYADIEVMWEMIQSSNHYDSRHNRGQKRPFHWNICFTPA